MNIKIERLNHIIQEEISMILMKEVKDENIKFVTITGVETTNDLSFSKVYYTVLNKGKLKEAEEALERASSFIITKLANTIEVRHTPEIRFIYDKSFAYVEHIEELIEKIKEEEK